MKIKFTPYLNFWIYFILMLTIYHLEVKHYFYWNYIAQLKGGVFDFSFFWVFMTVLIFLIDLKIFFSQKRDSLMFTVSGITLLLLTIPSLVAFTSKSMYSLELLIYHQVFFFILIGLGKVQLNVERVPKIHKKQSLLLLFVIVFIGIIPYIIAYGHMINIKNLFLVDVYETREKMAKISNPYFGYSYSIFTKIIIPILIVFALELRNKLLLVFGILFLLLFYLFGAHKTVYLGLFVILIFYKFSYESIIKKLVPLLNLLIVVCIVLSFFAIDYPWILTIRRVQFIPTLLDICYVDFFKDEPLFWSGSVLKRFIEYPYDVPHVNLIGETYFKQPEMGANNGLVSDGFMNANVWGVLFNSLVVGTYFMVLNWLKIPSKYFGLFLLVIFSFISSSVFTVLLTHGALFLLLISIFILNEKKQ